MNIGFDLDKIFINLPPLIPHGIIDFFYKGKANHELKYRIPSKAEQIIRVFTHHPVFRSPIFENINSIKNLNLKNEHKYFLVSSRFSFLKKRTDDLIRKCCFNKMFKSMHFNYDNRQPHEFKSDVIRKLNLDIFVDDDLQLLEYLTSKNPKTNFFWLNKKLSKTLKKNLFAITRLSEILK